MKIFITLASTADFKKTNDFRQTKRGDKKACGNCTHFYKEDQECQHQDLDGKYFSVDYKWNTCNAFAN